jgi:hypothetical protein
MSDGLTEDEEYEYLALLKARRNRKPDARAEAVRQKNLNAAPNPDQQRAMNEDNRSWGDTLTAGYAGAKDGIAKMLGFGDSGEIAGLAAAAGADGQERTRRQTLEKNIAGLGRSIDDATAAQTTPEMLAKMAGKAVGVDVPDMPKWARRVVNTVSPSFVPAVGSKLLTNTVDELSPAYAEGRDEQRAAISADAELDPAAYVVGDVGSQVIPGFGAGRGPSMTSVGNAAATAGKTAVRGGLRASAPIVENLPLSAGSAGGAALGGPGGAMVGSTAVPAIFGGPAKRAADWMRATATRMEPPAPPAPPAQNPWTAKADPNRKLPWQLGDDAPAPVGANEMLKDKMAKLEEPRAAPPAEVSTVAPSPRSKVEPDYAKEADGFDPGGRDWKAYTTGEAPPPTPRPDLDEAAAILSKETVGRPSGGKTSAEKPSIKSRLDEKVSAKPKAEPEAPAAEPPVNPFARAKPEPAAPAKPINERLKDKTKEPPGKSKKNADKKEKIEGARSARQEKATADAEGKMNRPPPPTKREQIAAPFKGEAPEKAAPASPEFSAQDWDEIMQMPKFLSDAVLDGKMTIAEARARLAS